MPGLSATDVLRAWEWGRGRGPVDQALILLALVFPDRSREQLAALSIGQRDGYLLTLREQTIGQTFDVYVECPRCSERLELSFSSADVRAIVPAGLSNSDHDFVRGDLAVVYRLPTSADLIAIADESEAARARSQLLERCVVQASRGRRAIGATELSEDEISDLADAMAERDPQAEVLLALTCPACEHRWQAVLDVAEFFWTEVVYQARRLLREVDTLARAYGWSESEILALSPTRREAYLELVGI